MHRFIDGEDRMQQALLPHSLEDYVDEENPVRVIEVFIDELDLAALGFSGMTPAATGRPAYHLRQFGRSFLAPVPHADGEACRVRGFRWLRWRRGHRLKPRRPQADAQARARNLQRANGDANQFGDFLTALAALDQILDLLDALGRELDLAATPDLNGSNP